MLNISCVHKHSNWVIQSEMFIRKFVFNTKNDNINYRPPVVFGGNEIVIIFQVDAKLIL